MAYFAPMSMVKSWVEVPTRSTALEITITFSLPQLSVRLSTLRFSRSMVAVCAENSDSGVLVMKSAD
jgi:hypothetical protein